jgi:alpha-tubulin suppressor-like RCC1 family protein
VVVPSPKVVPGLSAIDELAVGDTHGCARAGGAVWCWGDNDWGKCGPLAPVGDALAPTSVPLPGPAVGLALGDDFSCAVLDGGALSCWGRNHRGQLADDTLGGGATPRVSLGCP